jgi:hypothetical protein
VEVLKYHSSIGDLRTICLTSTVVSPILSRPPQNARGDKWAADYYRKVIDFIRADPNQYDDPELEAVFHRLVHQLDPPAPQLINHLITCRRSRLPTHLTTRDQNLWVSSSNNVNSFKNSVVSHATSASKAQ